MAVWDPFRRPPAPDADVEVADEAPPEPSMSELMRGQLADHRTASAARVFRPAIDEATP